jgi:hypothetical protein
VAGVVDVSVSPRVYIPPVGGVVHGFVLQGFGIPTGQLTSRHLSMTGMSLRTFLRRMMVCLSGGVAFLACFMPRGMRGMTPSMRFLIIIKFHEITPFL